MFTNVGWYDFTDKGSPEAGLKVEMHGPCLSKK